MGPYEYPATSGAHGVPANRDLVVSSHPRSNSHPSPPSTSCCQVWRIRWGSCEAISHATDITSRVRWSALICVLEYSWCQRLLVFSTSRFCHRFSCFDCNFYLPQLLSGNGVLHFMYCILNDFCIAGSSGRTRELMSIRITFTKRIHSYVRYRLAQSFILEHNDQHQCSDKVLIWILALC